jgi:hypothetical protein
MPIDPENAGAAPAAAGLTPGGSDMPPGAGGAEPGADDPGKSDAIHIQADMLPPGIAEGDTLKCTGMDENGAQFELVKGAATSTGESWEEGFRRDMSPQNPTAEAS